MILPIRTSIKPVRTPYTNYILIGINVAIFLLTYSPHYVAGTRIVEPLRLWAQQFMLYPFKPNLWQFVSYAFLHGGYAHIIGNMFFLYLFGNNVNDKLGHVGYLCFYLAGGVFSGIGHAILSNSPVLGASGAVAAVTGAYLVLFPQTLITVLYWFFFIGTTEVSALFFIGFKMIVLDNVIARYTPNVAYDAHLAGYAFGIVSVTVLIATGLISRSGFDLWSMLKQWNKRRVYRDVVSSGYDPFSGRNMSKKIEVTEVKKTPAQKAVEEEILQVRTKITDLFGQSNLAEAAEAYLELMEIDKAQILPQQYLLDIANQLMASGKWQESAQTYEKLLVHYDKYEYIEQIQLMLGILHSRYLHQPEAAVKYLQAARERLHDPSQVKMCNGELDKLLK